MPDWNSLFTEKENRWEQPYEDVVSLIENNEIVPGDHVLDLGCGAGRNLDFLEGHHITCVGMDNSINGLIFSKQKLQKSRNVVQLTLADMSCEFPFTDDVFDHVISIHVIFHNKRETIKKTLSEIKRVLKPGGSFLVTFNSKYSSRYGTGVEIESDTWIPAAGVDKGIPHHFSTLEDVVHLMNEFKVTNIKLEEKHNNGGLSCHWVVKARKE